MTKSLLALFFTTIFLLSCKNNEELNITPIVPINCDGLMTDTLGTNDNGKIYMPTAFTSNGDGKNDIIKPITQNITSIVFTLYDVNNNIVFSTTQLGQGWTAPSLQSNTYSKYYYKIQTTTASNRKIGTCGETYNLTCFPTTLIPRNTFYFEDQLTIGGFTLSTTENLPTCQ